MARILWVLSGDDEAGRAQWAKIHRDRCMQGGLTCHVMDYGDETMLALALGLYDEVILNTNASQERFGKLQSMVEPCNITITPLNFVKIA